MLLSHLPGPHQNTHPNRSTKLCFRRAKMKDEESQSTVKRQSSSSEFSTSSNGNGAGGVLFGRGRYKFWALAAILLLAFWSMFTGSVTLKWSSINNPIYNPLSDSPLHDDLDILEVEERERLVRRLWDVYTHSSTIRLPRFWQEAFEAAYEHLRSEAAGDRNAAITEIAKMSLLSLDVDPPPTHPSSTKDGSKNNKQSGKDAKAMGTTTARTRRL